MKNKFYITTPIYYINSNPHLGHSYTNIAADTIARFRRQLGDEVYFLTGTDEHGQKIQKAAEAQGLSPLEFANKMVKKFEDLWKVLGTTHNDFIRTTQERHVLMVQRALDILYKKGDIIKAEYEGWYCTPCENFWLESQISQSLVCPDCHRQLEKISETNYFLQISKYQEWLIQHIKDNKYFIRPETRYNEILSFLTNRLNDLCISRPQERLSWGIALPFSSGHVSYVWFDALINYISAVGSFDNNGRYSSEWWPADLHLIGKDILRQHAVYWPIILQALEIEPPKTIFAHGWWLINKAKMSKSVGNVVLPLDMVNKFGIDVYRYFLLRDVVFGADGNFSEEAIVKRFNSDLANDLGNLIYRTLTMVEKYFQGEVPQIDISNIDNDRQAENIIERMGLLDGSAASYISAAYDFNFSRVLEEVWELINLANKYIEDKKPWNLAKENKMEQLQGFIRLLVEVLRKVSAVLVPFMPQTAGSIKEQLGIDKVKKGKPLFPRLS